MHTWTSVLTIGLVVTSSFAADRLPVQLRAVAFENDTMPGLKGPLTRYNLPVLNENGDAAFIGVAGGLMGVWKEVSGDLTLVAREGDPAPGTVSATFRVFEDLIFNDAGHVAFVATLEGVPSTDAAGIWAEDRQGLHKVVQQGDLAPVPEDPENRYFGRPFAQDMSTIFPVVFNNQSQVAFYSELRFEDTSIAGEGLFMEVERELESVYSTRFPGTTGGFIDVSNNNTLNDQGAVGVVTTAEGNEIDVPGGPSKDDEAPDTQGAVFVGFGRPVINSDGALAFRGTLGGSAGVVVGLGENTAYFNTAKGLELIARENSSAPGTETVFNNLTGAPLLNDLGEVAFEAPLRGAPSDRSWGIWTTSGGGVLRLVIRAGDAVPGAEQQTVFRHSSALPFAKTYVLNARDNLLFVAQMTGPSIDQSNDLAIFAEVRGEVIMVLREGDLVEVGPGDIRTIAGFSDSVGNLGIAGGSGNADGRRSAFNNRDQVAVGLQFLGGTSGVFVIEDLELSLAQRDLLPMPSLDPAGHPSIDYTVIPGLEYRIERHPNLLDPGSGILVVPAFTPVAKERRRFTDTGIVIDPSAGLAPPKMFYHLWFEKKE